MGSQQISPYLLKWDEKHNQISATRKATQKRIVLDHSKTLFQFEIFKSHVTQSLGLKSLEILQKLSKVLKVKTRKYSKYFHESLSTL